MTQSFQVDLRGMVDLLARHLYSGPQVFLREVLQNGVDAITARAEHDPEFEPRLRVRSWRLDGEHTIDITDNGIGLTQQQAAELLATIGRSSKRDPELGLGRADYIGQFGIGMLAAFMVSEEIDVVSRSITDPSEPIRWRGRDDGTFEIETLTGDDPLVADLECGTRVRLRARPDASHWFDPEAVTRLATNYGELLPLDLAVDVQVGEEWFPRRITRDQLPWQATYSSPGARATALSRYCEDTFGFTPLGSLDLSVPLTGVSGVAFILPAAVAPGSGRHRVYVKHMLLGERVDDILPDWAFFVRAVINADGLNPTASREALHEDDVLTATREALATELKDWALRTLPSSQHLAREVVRTHHLALRAVATSDSEMLDLVASVLPFETTDGPATLESMRERYGEVVYADTTESYQRTATVARAQGLPVVNGGYVYDADLLSALANRPGWQVRQLAASDLVQVLTPLEPHRELEILDAIGAAAGVLRDADCDVMVREYSPDVVPAVLIRDRDGEHQRELAREHDKSTGVWGDVLGSFVEAAAAPRRLVLNDNSELVRRLLGAPDSEVFPAGIEALYLSAVMLAGDGLTSGEVEQLNTALDVLLRAGLEKP